MSVTLDSDLVTAVKVRDAKEKLDRFSRTVIFGR
jgi:hypothetical protein